MTLDAAQVERYARHVLLPEVGGRGQRRLLAARVAVLGNGAIARVTRDLVTRSGARMEECLGPSDAVVLADGHTTGADAPGRRPTILVRAAGRRARLVLFRSAPCPACVDPDPMQNAPAGAPPDPAVAAAAGALAATLVLGALLGRPGGSVVHELDLARVDLVSRRLTGPGCLACRTDA